MHLCTITKEKRTQTKCKQTLHRPRPRQASTPVTVALHNVAVADYRETSNRSPRLLLEQVT